MIVMMRKVRLPVSGLKAQSGTDHLPPELHDFPVHVIYWALHHALGHVSAIQIRSGKIINSIEKLSNQTKDILCQGI